MNLGNNTEKRTLLWSSKNKKTLLDPFYQRDENERYKGEERGRTKTHPENHAVKIGPNPRVEGQKGKRRKRRGDQVRERWGKKVSRKTGQLVVQRKRGEDEQERPR